MPVTNITKDTDTRQLTITAEFVASAERVWRIYEDPRQLEQIWGPPEYPATFTAHELRPGTRTTYYMTSPEGERFGGYWDITGVESPSQLRFDDGFADGEGTPDPDLPVSDNVYTFSESDGRTTAVFTSTYATAEALQQVLDMGMEEGATAAINQVDAYLAANPDLS